MSKKIVRQNRHSGKRSTKPTAKPEPAGTYTRDGLADRIDAEVIAARLAVARLLETMAPSTALDRNAGQALDVPTELARIAVALRGIRSASAFVRCLEVAS